MLSPLPSLYEFVVEGMIEDTVFSESSIFPGNHSFYILSGSLSSQLLICLLYHGDFHRNSLFCSINVHCLFFQLERTFELFLTKQLPTMSAIVNHFLTVGGIIRWKVTSIVVDFSQSEGLNLLV